MGLFIFRSFWFILVVASGLAVGLLAASKFGMKVELNSWVKASGLNNTPVVNEIADKTTTFLDFPLIQSYGFYGGLGLFLIFLLIFLASKGSQEDQASVIETESFKDKVTDNSPDTLDDTLEGSGTVTEITAETNSDAVVGTDGEIYDGNATFSGTSTYAHLEIRPEINDEAGLEDETEEESSALAVEADETGLSHLSDAELKSKTLDFLDDLRRFEVDYQLARDSAATELMGAATGETSKEDLLNLQNASEQRQADFSSEFMNKYKPEAMSVRQEISKRLGISDPSDNFSPALDNAILVGANPVADTADVIEELLNRLA